MTAISNAVEPSLVTEYSFEWKIDNYTMLKTFSQRFLLGDGISVVIDLVRGKIEKDRTLQTHKPLIYFENISSRDSEKLFKVQITTSRGYLETSLPYAQLKSGSVPMFVNRFLDDRNVSRSLESGDLKLLINITIKDLSNCFVMKPALTLRNAMKSLLHDEEFDDFTFKVQNEEFHVHKAIVYARSVVLKKIIADTETDNVRIDGVSSEVFQEILNFIYCDQIRNKKDNLDELLKGAKQFELQGLEQMCQSLLKLNLIAEKEAIVTEKLRKVKPKTVEQLEKIAKKKEKDRLRKIENRIKRDQIKAANRKIQSEIDKTHQEEPEVKVVTTEIQEKPAELKYEGDEDEKKTVSNVVSTKNQEETELKNEETKTAKTDQKRTKSRKAKPKAPAYEIPRSKYKEVYGVDFDDLSEPDMVEEEKHKLDSFQNFSADVDSS